MLSISPILASLALAAAQPHADDGSQIPTYVSEGICAAVFQVGDKFGYRILDPDFHVLEVTQRKGDKWKKGLPKDTVLITCTRSSPLPAPFDYRLPLNGVDFSIMLLPRIGRKFMGTLTYENDAFAYEVKDGALNDSEQAELTKRLDWFARAAAEDKGE